jgi:outer membrane protein
MKRFYQTLLFCLVIPLWTHAQNVKTFTLDEAIKYALENSVGSQNATLDEQIAAARVKETRGIGLPQIEATSTITHNTKLPRFFAAYNPRGGIINLGDADYIQTGDVYAAQNFFQLENSADASISVNQIIFNGSYIVGLQAANAYRELAKKSTNQTNEQIIQNVTKAYYTVMINQERITLFDNNIARVDTLFRNTQALNKNGFAESIDVDRIQVTLTNLITERDKFLNLNALGIELLKFQMNYPMTDSIAVTGDLGDIQIESNPIATLEEINYTARTDYQLLQANQKLQELNLKNIRAASLPSLSAFATFGYQTQSNDIGGLFKTNTNLSSAPDSIKQAIGPDKWYNYSFVGVQLRIPLFSGLQQRYKVQQQKLELKKVENNFRQMKSAIDLESRQVSIMYTNALKSLQSQKQNMDLASNIARVTKIKYEQGVGSNIEVIEAESSLKEAQTNYYNALYDVLNAKVDLDKAYGRLLTPTSK